MEFTVEVDRAGFGARKLCQLLERSRERADFFCRRVARRKLGCLHLEAFARVPHVQQVLPVGVEAIEAMRNWIRNDDRTQIAAAARTALDHALHLERAEGLAQNRAADLPLALQR